MTEPQWLFERAADCYDRAGHQADAARCYRESGSFSRSADLFLGLDRYREAAEDLARSGRSEVAAWVLVHLADDPGAARAQLASAGGSRGRASAALGELRRRVIIARCEIAERTVSQGPPPVLADVGTALRDHTVPYDPVLEEWAIALAESAGRPDQVALLFAAAVQGNRDQAAERWSRWSLGALGCDVLLPAGEVPGQSGGHGDG